MKRSLLARVERLERARAPAGGPLLVLSFTPLPEELTADAVARWVSEGLAHPYAGSDHVFVYDGGQRSMTVEEWEAKYCNA